MAVLVIRQYDVVENPNPSSRTAVPYLLILQSHLFEALNTLIVAPIFPAVSMPPDNRVLLPIEIDGQPMTINLALMANIERRGLGSRVINLLEEDYEIRRGIDRLFTGF